MSWAYIDMRIGSAIENQPCIYEARGSILSTDNSDEVMHDYNHSILSRVGGLATQVILGYIASLRLASAT